MTAFLFIGDLLVMLFMVAVVVWVSLVKTPEENAAIARIPLEDDSHG